MRMMIVDDSSIIRNRIAQLANHPDLPRIDIVGMARHGGEAVSLFAQHRPDIVTMDLTMPEMDGIDCIKRLVLMSDNVRILVVSALGDKRTALQALMCGAHGYLHKPFTNSELVGSLRELMKD
ncbi:MAG: response regulator [Moraxellaceae bacterium]|nr:response regulator [Moraxellaceae bacterium]